jgi:hypothetical protein
MLILAVVRYNVACAPDVVLDSSVVHSTQNVAAVSSSSFLIDDEIF